jgi:hypothetical protein
MPGSQPYCMISFIRTLDGEKIQRNRATSWIEKHFMNNRFYNIDSDTRGHRVLRKNKVDTYGASFFAPDYSAAVLAAKMCTNSNDHTIFI